MFREGTEPALSKSGTGLKLQAWSHHHKRIGGVPVVKTCESTADWTDNIIMHCAILVQSKWTDKTDCAVFALSYLYI